MKRTRGRVVHIETLSDLDRRLAAGAQMLPAWRVRGLDLRDRTDALLERRVAGASFLGCTFAPGDAERLSAAGALVLPAVDGSPLDVYRGRLYSPTDLYDTAAYADTFDARVFSWSQRVPDRDDALSAALHDHAIDEALRTWVEGRRIVGVMGGHAAERGSAEYADAVHLGRALGADHVVAKGGGPGAMEAANLGAR
ncbi:MAG: Rossmann fold nucleotide-binding protein, partial [Nocardioides sp.]